MKKILFVICITMTMVGCKECPECVENTSTQQTSKACIGLSDYRSLSTIEEKAQWLRDNGKNVCEDTIYQSTIDIHSIPTTATIVRATGNSLNMSWQNINTFISSTLYNGYVAFDFDSSNNITNIKLIPVYNKNITCYSVPLLKSIARKNSFTNVSMIEFYNATVNSKPTVIIKAGTTSLYDFSDEPRFDKDKSPI
ncbi:MAG: hypothetical protein V4581_09005 [Bacteroidota bacterium]